jgi:endonuclease YncB( thermonuclease family)
MKNIDFFKIGISARSLQTAVSCERVERRNRSLHGENMGFGRRPGVIGGGAVDLEQVFRRIFLILMMAMTPFSVASEIYQWRDRHGKTYFSDVKNARAKLVKIKPGYGYYFVKRVFDGDTVMLENGTKIRFLGINAPEVEHRNKPGQQGGKEAKRWLEQAVSGKKIRLQKDLEKKDKYGRTLAHVFTEDHRHLNLELVEAGLAAVNIHPPNLKFTKELLRAQDYAEMKKLGIWQYPQYQPKTVASLEGKRPKGWQRVVGSVVRIRQSRKYAYLVFSKQFDARIALKNLSYFPDIRSYVGKKIEIRGWLSRRKKHLSMLIRHPAAIKIVE